MKKYLLLALCGLFCIPAFSSFGGNTMPSSHQEDLLAIIQDFKQKYRVHFTYDREIVENVRIDHYEPDSYADMDDAMKKVLHKTKLKYVVLEKQYVIIYQDDEKGMESVQKMIGALQSIIDQRRQPKQSTSVPLLTTRSVVERNGKPSIRREQFGITVTGSVTDSGGEALIGATILVKGTSVGTATDLDGSFELSNVDEDAILIFSYTGFRSLEIPVEGRMSINAILHVDAQTLNEVVVVGYGTVRRMDVTSAVSSVKSEDFITGNVSDAAQLIKGKVAGLTIVNPTGDPSATSQILLRGTATLATSTQPLILIDGVPGNLNTIAPDDIESIDVLKDGSAAAIYGTRGTNGVILITSKRGAGFIEPSITYSGYVSTEEFVREPEMLNAKQYRDRIAQGYSFADLGAETDWLSEIKNKAPITHSHSVSIRGGSNKTNYLGALTFRQTPGMIAEYSSKRINGRVDVNQSMFDDRVKINLNYISRNEQRTVDFNQLGQALADFSTSSVYNQALWRNPTAPIKNEDGSWHEETSKSYYANPVGLLKETYGGLSLGSTRISGSVSWMALEGLNLKMFVSRSNDESEASQGQTKRHLSTVRDGLQGFASKSFFQGQDDLLELTADYQTTIDKHSINVLAGYSYQENEFQNTFLRNWGFPAGDFSYPDNIGAGQRSGLGGPFLMNSSRYSSNLIGFFGRISYIYDQKYLITISQRYEGSSKFIGTDKPWGLFPAVSVGWHLGEEAFLEDAIFIDALKLRAGYGVTGTAPDQYYLGVPLLGFEGSFLINGSWVPSLSPSRNPNPSLRWEEKKEVNIGLDFALFDNVISGSIDFYNRTTNGLLYDYTVPTPPNAFRTTTANVGIMENQGFEFLLNFAPVSKGKFSWRSNVSFSTNRNKLVSLSNDLYETTNPWFNAGYTGSPVQTYTHRVEVGKEIGNFYGYKVVDITPEGKWVYENANGESSETRVEDDKQILGNGLPQYYAAWNNTLTYGRFDLSIAMRGAFGFQLLNFQRMYSENPGLTTYNQLVSANHNVFGKVPLNDGVPIEFNSYYVENGDYWKVDNIRLGYSFDASRLKYFSQASVYFSTLNTFMFTGYQGMDPEVNRLGLTPGNDDRFKYPSTRNYSIGFNFTIK